VTLMISWLAAIAVGVGQFVAQLLFAEGIDWR
jgi:hypothetical protein